MLNEEENYYSDIIYSIAGVDEAGRGPLAGPVCAAAVIFPRGYKNDLINDSKQLTEKKREKLYDEIIANALSYGIAFASADEIDQYNIYEATKRAMRAAIAQLNVPYQAILTDAMPLSGYDVPVYPLIKGDARCMNIAGASILAKVTRDRYMKELEKTYPAFSFSVHKGYGTKAHMEELEKNGPIEGVHRKSFKPIAKFYSQQMSLFD
ncbi:MAG: ribonuclease HII [Bacilli bacterium]|nr:ribonuclease HII [Bacilli bacterium]